jgi:hypothetical protein
MIKKNTVGVIIYIISSLIVCIYLKKENDNLRKNLQEISDTNVDRIVDLIACRETSSNLKEELTFRYKPLPNFVWEG